MDYSQLRNNVVFVIVLVDPFRGSTEVGITKELTTALSPSHRFHFSMTPKYGWV